MLFSAGHRAISWTPATGHRAQEQTMEEAGCPAEKHLVHFRKTSGPQFLRGQMADLVGTIGAKSTMKKPCNNISGRETAEVTSPLTQGKTLILVCKSQLARRGDAIQQLVRQRDSRGHLAAEEGHKTLILCKSRLSRRKRSYATRFPTERRQRSPRH